MSAPSALAHPRTDAVRDDARAFFVIVPNISLSDRAASFLYGGLLAVSALAQFPILANGWWPISLFLLIDTMGLMLALHVFRLCQRHRREEICIEDGNVTIRRFTFRSEPVETRISCYGLAQIRCDDPDFGCRQIWLAKRGERIEVARDLSPVEREEFSLALSEALRGYGVPCCRETLPGWALLAKGPYAP
jgi:uncharacterized membrane protein